MKRLAIWLLVIATPMTIRAETDLRIPIHVNKPDRLATASWPVTFGVPFKRGEFREPGKLGIVDDRGKPVPSEIVQTGDWEDGSTRWVSVDFSPSFDRQYFVVAARGEGGSADNLKLTESPDRIEVETSGARYTLRKGAGCFESIQLDANRNGKFEENETLVSGAGGAFYVVDSKDRRGVMAGKELKIERNGKRHAIVRVAGDYLAPDGAKIAEGVVYFHFYAGHPFARLSHKFTVIENTNELWFKDVGVTLPLATGDATTATFANDHAKPASTFTKRLDRGHELVLVQDEFPHFGSTNSHYGIHVGAQRDAPLQSGPAAGDWADVSSKRWGLAAQVPGFAEQFPKAFRAGSTNLTIKLWASEGGKELDYRTPEIIKNYFGHDWIPEKDPCVTVANTGEGTAKIHEIWLYPHAGALTKETIATFGATRDEIYAHADPGWVARSEVFGPIHPKDEKRFPREEAVISDYFDRSVLAGDKVFPATGYLYWGMYPYSAQGWELKNGRWYPTIHRLARSLEYNLKRGMWILYARSGERKYFDYARRYTRLCGNLLFSNADTPIKPAGWMVQGNFHSPIIWGQFGPAKPGSKPQWKMDSGGMCIAYASSEDVIQFVYDWFLTGDLHSRDMALLWKEAMIEEMKFDVEKALQFFPPSAFFRVLGSGYELDHDPRLLDYGSKIMKRRVLADGKHILNPDVKTNFGKEGEVFSGYYYYHVATGDPLARKALVELAKFRYQHAQLDYFFSRSSALQHAFAFAWRDTKDDGYAEHVAQAAKVYAEGYRTLAEMGIDFAKLSPATTNEFGQATMTGQGPIHVGIPIALRVAAEHGKASAYLPYAIKQQPTARTHILLKKEKPGTALLDVFVNNWGDRGIEPKLLDANGKPVKIQVVERVYDRIGAPECYDAYGIWYMCYEDQLFYKLRIPDSPPGVYELDLGDEINFTILRSDIEKILQVAPKGTVLSSGRRHYFPVTADTEAIEYFTSRPVRVFDPDGKEITPQQIEGPRFRINTKDKPGAWSLEGGSDQFIGVGKGSVEAFVKIETLARGGNPETNVPLVLALGDPQRLFEFDRSKYAIAPTPEAKVDAGNPFVASRPNFGKAARLANRFIEVARSGDAQFPRERGTVEFWLRPQWSATDCHMIGGTFPSTIRVEFFKALPFSLVYFIDPDNGGRVTRYNIAYLGAVFDGLGNTRSRVFLENNKWYHIAMTWNLDGANNDAALFINGRKKALWHYQDTLPSTKPVTELKPPGDVVRFGSAHLHGRIPTSEDFDELRISRTIRYTTDFEPPTAPFAHDADTYLLHHMDGDEQALINGQPAPSKWVNSGRM